MSTNNNLDSLQTPLGLTPFRIVLLYTIVSMAWIIVSDRVSAKFSNDLHQFEQIASFKGVAFILLSAGLLHLLLHHYRQQLACSHKTFREAEQEITKLAYFDHDTGLPNHHLLRDRLDQVVAFNSRKQKNTAIIYISLTGFKALIDARGHSVGDEAIRIVAERLSTTLRHYDTVARIHRDEFVVVLGGEVQEGDAARILAKLQSLFAEPLRLDGDEIIFPACFGIACFPADGVTSETLLQHAHIAMNQARKNGAPFQYYSDSLNDKALERHHIETGLHRAIDDGEFYLVYQPKMSIDGIFVVGMEALVRWQRPGEGIISPDKFIPVAEENGSIIKLGAYVLREACRQNKVWHDAGFPKLAVAVNLSARQLRDNEFVPTLMQVLEETRLEPAYLELELTESVLMGDTSDTICKLLRLRELGISISVDDFGTGYSSLSYLKHLPINSIKVDRSFVRDIVNDPDDAAIVDAIVAMAHSLKLNVVAEGVETREQLEFLRQRNCQNAQGYYFAKPLDPQQFEAFIAKTRQLGEVSVVSPELQLHNKPLMAADNELSTDSSPLKDNFASEHIGAISLPITPANPGDNLAAVLKRFQNEKDLVVLPVVDNGRTVGIINRATFLEEHVIGLNGFAFHINHSKKMRDLMSPVKLEFDFNVSIRTVAQVLQAQQMDVRVDNICVTWSGSYHGIVDVNCFINAITDINLTLAKGANPLTGLPGNESIQREINDRLQAGADFDIAYIDIDNFKPFNDYYGFQKGDEAIKIIGDIISGVSCKYGKDFACFCGHIGGDDFILITGPHHAEYLSGLIIKELDCMLPLLHGQKDYSAGCYSAMNRKGEPETFGLLSISIGIVNTRLSPINSYPQLASIATDVKKAAKKLPGSSVVVNRRA